MLARELKRLAKFGHAPHCEGPSDDCNLCVAIDRYARDAYDKALVKSHAIVKKAQDGAA